MMSSEFETLVNESCKILDCDRASVFLIDPKTNDLWSKAAKNSAMIKVPITKGIAGLVARTGETVNILDAQSDTRLMKDADKSN